MKNLSSILRLIKTKTKEFKKSPILRFEDFIKSNWRPRSDKLNFIGVYAIYENEDALIYIGHAGKGKHLLKYRIADLFYNSELSESFKHTLTKKLLTKIKRFKNIGELRQFYLERCYFRVIQVSNVGDARILEETLISLLKPKYNEE